MQEPLLLTVGEAARVLNIGRRLAYTLVMSGELPSVKLRRCRRVSRSELQRYVERLTEEGEGDNQTR